ncbi:hypothetical protein Cs7R123_20610 [Catellatospora sp. TT07R-123]|uniref:DUF952 domain-containing protein n=1 Tax=Catellatospora sp. TT07R-123 TaxID=2733863 RepID=UPI001B2A931C|nr:DUF952 domain-containing protein [Catellatospora sp. TT07R-123]GHJ44719.1 hypothetical protein Cs7R123_20610 [Catellatospora sp. TT07R-123]
MIYQIALPEDWAQAQYTGSYTVSTRGVSLEQEGFLHASDTLEQIRAVRGRYYADRDDLLLVEIDESLLDVPVVRESPAGSAELYPHIYGPLPLSAVVRVGPLP